jgi:transcriptional regulator with GAF, ATPase, and Fis domain
MGLDRSDFHKLQTELPDAEDKAEAQDSSREAANEAEQWSSAEDRLLVELVLEKLKLSKSDWQDCARSLGKDRGSVGRRWKSLMGGGEIGLKNRSRRGKIHATWRS